MIIIDLLYNLAVLIAISLLSGFIDKRFPRTVIHGQIFQGLLFGFAAVIGMNYPFVLTEGIIFDGRSIVISLCSLFFGPISGIISAIIAIIYRLIIGGGGVMMGVSVITASFGIGYLYHVHKSRSSDLEFSNFKLYQMGILVHAAMLLLVLLLPPKNIIEVYKTISITVIGVYPLVTLLIGRILLDQKINSNYLKKLGESERLFRTTLYSIGDGVITTDTKARIINMNAVAEHLTGWRENEAQNKPLNQIFRIINEKTRMDAEDPVQRVIEKGGIVNLAEQTVLVSKDGKEIPIADSGSPIMDDDDKILGVVLVFKDQTDERARNKLLVENEERLRLSLKAGNQGLYDLNVKTGEALVNDDYASMLGYDPKTFVETNSNWIERLHPDDKPVTAKAYLDYVEGRTNEYKVEFRQKTKDNGWKWILSLGKIVEYDSDGNPLRMLGTHTDISELKQTIAALQKSEEKFAKMFRSSPDTITLSSLTNGLIVDVNEACIEKTGYARDEIIGKTVIDLNLWADLNDRNEYVNQLLSKGEISNFETRFRMKSGELRDALISGEVIELGGEKFILGVIRDVTEQKRSEQRLRENEKLFSTIFHSNPAAVAITNMQTGQFTNVNQTWQNITGYSEFEAIGRSSLELNLWKNDNQRAELIDTLRKQKNVRAETQLKRKSGEVIYLLSSAELIQLSGEEHLLTMAQDITERIKMEESILEHSLLLKTVVSNVSVIIFCIDANGIITFSDGKGLHALGLKPGEVVGKSAFEMYSEFPHIVQALKRALKGELQTAIQEMGELTFEVFYTPLKTVNGYISGLIGVVTDITERKKMIDALIQSEENYRLLFESNPHPMFVFELETLKFLNVNHAAVNKYGYSFDEFMNMTIKDIRPPHDIPKLLEIVSKLTSGIDEVGIWIHKKKDGTLIDVEIVSHTLLYEGKKAELVVAFDVTDKVKAEKALRESERKFKSIFDSTPVPLAVNDNQLKITQLNKAFIETFGYTLEDIPTVDDWWPKAYPNIEYRNLVRSTWLDRMKLTSETKEPFEPMEVRICCKDGSFKTVVAESAWRGDTIFTEQLVVLYDITERKRIEEERQLLTNAIESSLNEIYIFDAANLIFKNINHGALKNLGYSKDRLLTMTPLDVKPQYTFETFNELLLPLREKKLQRLKFETIHRRADGSDYPVEAHLQLFETGTNNFFLAIINDITERRISEKKALESQQQLRALTAKLQKIREDERVNLSRELHDNLGQSLTGLKMDVAWLSRRLSKKSSEKVESILEKTQTMNELIDQIINDVRRISSDLRPNLLDHLGLLPALDWLVNDFMKRTETESKIISSIEKFNISPAAETAVFRIMQEAFTNISRHSNATKVQVSIDQTEDEYIVELKDNGKGISEDEIVNLRSLGIRGMQERAIQLGGRLSIKGIAGKGTTIIVNIPKEKLND